MKKVPEFFQARLRMKEKMDSEIGKKIYVMRKIVVEPVIGNIKENQGVRVVSYMNPDVKIDAVITQVSPTLEPNTRTFKAIIQINNRDLALRPGMFVKAEIITASRENTIVIPKNIILVRRTNKTVFVIEDGVARQRTIKTGLENPDEVEVIDGLYESDYLVVEGFETLRNGSRVTISNR
ncbi:efflux RND transporter periplasmic adaptor subunit [candidate division KSB1 bacterium]|nr:efflux RND transporter periplasmic adaptor subunit [candidate division KSB1 bacterium]